MIQRVLMATVVLILLDLLRLMAVHRRNRKRLDDIAQVFVQSGLRFAHLPRPLYPLCMRIRMELLRAFMQVPRVICNQLLDDIRPFVDCPAIPLHIDQFHLNLTAVHILH